MNRTKASVLFAALTVATIALPASMANAQGYDRGRTNDRDGWVAPYRQVIPWSFADYKPNVPRGEFTGLYIWHDRNTVHVATTDNRWFGDRFDGFVEIKGGTFDNVKGEHDRDDTRFRQISANRIAFSFRATDPDVPEFKFNIHEGDRLIFHIALDRHRTGRIFYRSAKAAAQEDPVVFNLNK